eukprot:3053180-Prymnesium_polylepis.1
MCIRDRPSLTGAAGGARAYSAAVLSVVVALTCVLPLMAYRGGVSGEHQRALLDSVAAEPADKPHAAPHDATSLAAAADGAPPAPLAEGTTTIGDAAAAPPPASLSNGALCE